MRVGKGNCGLVGNGGNKEEFGGGGEKQDYSKEAQWSQGPPSGVGMLASGSRCVKKVGPCELLRLAVFSTSGQKRIPPECWELGWARPVNRLVNPISGSIVPLKKKKKISRSKVGSWAG